MDLKSIRRRFSPKGPIPWAIAVAMGIFAGVWGGRLVLSCITGSVAIVEGTSMVPTFESGARVYISPLERPLKRGEIVLVNDGLGGCAIKRVVGLPREKVNLWRGYVFIDGQMLREPYLPKYTFTHPDERNGKLAFALGVGCYFVLGDNRLCSSDSRYYGPVLQDQIVNVVQQSAGPTPEFAPFALPVHGRQTIRRLEGATAGL